MNGHVDVRDIVEDLGVVVQKHGTTKRGRLPDETIPQFFLAFPIHGQAVNAIFELTYVIQAKPKGHIEPVCTAAGYLHTGFDGKGADLSHPLAVAGAALPFEDDLPVTHYPTALTAEADNELCAGNGCGRQPSLQLWGAIGDANFPSKVEGALIGQAVVLYNRHGGGVKGKG